MSRTIPALAVAGLSVIAFAASAEPPIRTTNVAVVNTPNVNVTNGVLQVEVGNADAIPVSVVRAPQTPYYMKIPLTILGGDGYKTQCVENPRNHRLTGIAVQFSAAGVTATVTWEVQLFNDAMQGFLIASGFGTLPASTFSVVADNVPLSVLTGEWTKLCGTVRLTDWSQEAVFGNIYIAGESL